MQEELDPIFASGGPLSRTLPGFKVRRQQALMASRIAAALETRATLLVEAGTGTGKTFAYLVPALLSGLRVLISTGTRTLQDQLFSKDLPLLAVALGRPARVALLKGRGNYLCLLALSRALQAQAGAQRTLPGLGEVQAGEAESETELRAMLERIERWSWQTPRGDLAEVPGLSDSHPVWPQVTATRDSCLGGSCPELARCHVARSRREAQAADVVIINHHLLLSDLALKEEGFADLLGSADALIIDEAHQLPDLATQHFGVVLASRTLEGLLAEVEREMGGRGELSPAGTDVRRILEAADEARGALKSLSAAMPLKAGRYPLSELPAAVTARARELGDALELLAQLLAVLAEPEAVQLAARVRRRQDELTLLAAADETEGARAAEVEERAGRGSFALSLTPLSIDRRFGRLREASGAGWIFTSATLSVGEDFSHFAGRLGLSDATTLKIGSPFDYESQALLYLPRGLPAPADPGYPPAVIDTALPLIEAAGGGAFLLFTSHRALKAAAASLRERASVPYPLLVQGEAPRERQLAAFREAGNAVLLGTASFWEGVDVQGEALRLVVIEKLPFASPEDPLVRARIEHLRAQGVDPFREHQLPAAVLALRQGVGRLIRSEDDHGVVVICDPRMHGRGYGKVFLAALPPMSVTLEPDEALRFLRRHFPGRAGKPVAPAARAG
jgi:ATP-dependent DNA helicase DinG